MLKASQGRPGPLRVIILTPGVNGMGGISRLMDWVDAEIAGRPSSPVRVKCVSTRGDVRYLRPLVFLSALVRVALACFTGRCDVLHVNIASFGSTYRKLLLCGLARLSGKPYVLHLHGGAYREFWTLSRPWLAKLVDAMFRNASRVVVLGEVWSKLVTERVPSVSQRLTIMPNAVPRPAAAHSPVVAEPVEIIFIGRLNAEKGVPQLLEALAAMREEPGWRAVLAGDGDVEATREEVRSLGLADWIAIPGWLSAAQIDELWQRAGLLVLPSFIENLPLSIIEAFSHGVAVIATPVGSIPELVEDGRTGLLVPPGDSAALGAALSRLVADPSLRKRLARQGRQEYEARYELSGYVDRLMAVWAQAARGTNTPADAGLGSQSGTPRAAGRS